MKMISKPKIFLASGLALLFTAMQIDGWQRSMKYGTSVHTSAFFQNIGVLEVWQCLLIGCMEWIVLSILIYKVFSFLENRREITTEKICTVPKYFWLVCAGIIGMIYLIILIGCYPGFYNYDGENQLIQVLYDETPYSSHHPLLHTLLIGGLVKFGYQIRNVDLTLGVFLYNAVQMGICALCFGYAVQFVYKHTGKRIWTILSLLFYALCPPVVLFAMSTTKDNICFALLLAAVMKLYDIYQADADNKPIHKKDWILAGTLLAFSCLMRNNIAYALLLMAGVSFFQLVFKRKKGMFVLYISVMLLQSVVNTGLEKALDATPGAITEALSVPFQQLARLYADEGESAFNEEELELLYQTIEPEMLGTYDPMIADSIKYSFWRHWDVILDNKWDFLSLWVRKGIQYPGAYIDSFLDNTYQAWYPSTLHTDKKGLRYSYTTEWMIKNQSPKIPKLFDYFCDIAVDSSYSAYPVIRLFFSIGAMLWVFLAAWVYALWSKNKALVYALLPVLCVFATNLLGPVADIRYYLILFYVLPLCVGSLFSAKFK